MLYKFIKYFIFISIVEFCIIKTCADDKISNDEDVNNNEPNNGNNNDESNDEDDADTEDNNTSMDAILDANEFAELKDLHVKDAEKHENDDKAKEILKRVKNETSDAKDAKDGQKDEKGSKSEDDDEVSDVNEFEIFGDFLKNHTDHADDSENEAAYKRKQNETSDASKDVPIASLFQGDIELDEDDKNVINNEVNGTSQASKRNVMTFRKKIWRTRVIPYDINHPGTRRHPARETESIIKKVFANLEKLTCLKFRPKSYSDKNWMYFHKGIGCHSGIGRKYYKNAATTISLGEMCIVEGIITHEILHALGFFHEQSRPDRNTYVKLFYQKIRGGMTSNFDRVDYYEGDLQGSPYDFQSIMHYAKTAFSIDGSDTIESKSDANKKLGNTKLSQWDIKEINKLYQCDIKAGPWGRWIDWTKCFKFWTGDCKSVRQRFCISENPEKDCPEANKYGVQEQKKKCKPEYCKEILDANWGDWGSWLSCDKPCGEGTRTRFRQCDNPSKVPLGTDCVGAPSLTEICRIKKCKTGWYDTSFDDSLGTWTQDDKDDFDWTRKKGLNNPATGPKEDHTTGTGYYAVAESGSSFNSGKKARLKSKLIPANFGEKCLSFFYQMNGKHVGKLDMYMVTSTSKITINLWQKIGHQGDYWIKGGFTLPKMSEEYQIYIEAKIKYAPYSDIAIDDIFIDDGKCVKGLQECKDHYPGCKDWQYIGECYKNTPWMLNACCESCSGMYECKNKFKDSSKCPMWAKYGACSPNVYGKGWALWMWKSCCRSCKACVDKYDECTKWAAIKGECKRSKWMRRNCKTSCKICKS